MNFDVIANAPLVIQIHIWTGCIALALGIVMWARPKGTRGHKLIGRAFLVLMLITAITAIFIRLINDGKFSFIHIFVPITFLGVWQAVYHIRRGNLKRHKSAVKGMFFGALLIPGVLSFLPGRLMWHAIFG